MLYLAMFIHLTRGRLSSPNFTGPADLELSDLDTAERSLYMLEIAKEYRRIYQYQVGTELERLPKQLRYAEYG